MGFILILSDPLSRISTEEFERELCIGAQEQGFLPIISMGAARAAVPINNKKADAVITLSFINWR